MCAEEAVVEIRDLETRFGRQVVHENLNLDVQRGKIVALVGGSGCGKTTLLREILMLTHPSKGSIRLFGQQVIGAGQATRNRLSRRLGMLFQRGALFTSLTIRENILTPLHEHTTLSKRLLDEVIRLKIALVGLPPDTADKFPAQLSGGMIKRAALARALALDPDILFLDEPSAGLDPVSAAALDDLILQLRASLGLTVLMVTHDLDSLWRIVDRVAFIGERHVLGYGSMQELSRSQQPAIQEYLQGPRGRAARPMRA